MLEYKPTVIRDYLFIVIFKVAIVKLHCFANDEVYIQGLYSVHSTVHIDLH